MHGILLDGNGKGNDVVIVIPDLKIHNIKSAIHTYLGDDSETEDEIDIDMLNRKWYYKKDKVAHNKKVVAANEKRKLEEEGASEIDKLRIELKKYVDDAIGKSNKGRSGYHGTLPTTIPIEYLQDLQIVTVDYSVDSTFGFLSKDKNHMITIQSLDNANIRLSLAKLFGVDKVYSVWKDDNPITVKLSAHGSSESVHQVNVTRFGI